MTSKLGVYWSVHHRYPHDYAYFEALQPAVFKIMDGGNPDYVWAHDNLPDTLCIARDWAMSEQHDDMLANPVGTGQRHAREWNDHQPKLGFDRAKTLILGINEPKVWEAGVPEALRLYTISLCLEAKNYGLRVGAMQLGVGWPDNNGPDTPPDWSPWAGVEAAIIDNGGALVCHEYWADNGPGELWGWWGGRTLKCPWQVPIIIGECGIDYNVKKGVPQEERPWGNYTTDEGYANQLCEYANRMGQDQRFIGCCVFASDFAAEEWEHFDYSPCYPHILSVKPADTPPSTIHLPAIGTGQPAPQPKTAYVAAPSGLNLRVQPSTDGQLLLAVPFGEPVTVIGINGNATWNNVTYNGQTGWMVASLLAPTKPTGVKPTQPTQPTPPSGDNWARAWPIVLDIEGGLSTDPNDPGNYRPDGTFVGTKFGISANAHPDVDIVNLTKEQALEIYKSQYWQASGADKLPWPMSLVVFDTAVQHGVGVAKQLINDKPTPEEVYLGQRALRYFDDPNWVRYGVAWGNRIKTIRSQA